MIERDKSSYKFSPILFLFIYKKNEKSIDF